MKDLQEVRMEMQKTMVRGRLFFRFRKRPVFDGVLFLKISDATTLECYVSTQQHNKIKQFFTKKPFEKVFKYEVVKVPAKVDDTLLWIEVISRLFR